MYGLASIVAPFLVATLSHYQQSWRVAYIVAALIPVPVLLSSVFIHNQKSKDLQKGIAAHMDKSVGSEMPMVFLATMTGFYVVAEIMVSSRLALYIQLVHGANTESASWYVVGFFVGLFLGRVLCTLTKLPFSIKKQMLISLVGSVVCIFAGLYIHPLGLCLTGIAMAPFYPLSISYICSFFPKRMDTALAWVLSIAAIMIVSMHLTIGYLTDSVGIEKALWLGPGFLALSFILLMSYEKVFVKIVFLFVFCMPVLSWGGLRPALGYAVGTRIVQILDSKTLRATSNASDWQLGDVLAIQSQNKKHDVIGFVQLIGIENNEDSTFNLKLDLLRHSRFHLVQIGDRVMTLDLTKEDPEYHGNTDLIIRRRAGNTSARYKPLVLLGATSAETAQNLWENETLISIYGLAEYGARDWLTMGTLLPADFLGSPNLFFKAKMKESQSNVLSSGLMYTKSLDSKSTVNYNFYWDSISSESTILHSLLSVALLTYDGAKDSISIQSAGTSSLQTVYEFIVDNWDRFLVGPSFNVEKKSVGGYIGYIFIWDRFHLQLSLTSTNITSMKLAPSDGYYPFIDAYWRF